MGMELLKPPKCVVLPDLRHGVEELAVGTGECVVVDGPPMETAGNHVDLAGIGSAFAPEYHPEEVFEMAQKLYKKAKS